jgi:EamA domain-containing membrane protein RarD
MDVIILIFLAIKIGKLAISKGLSASKWRLNLVLAWIGGEIVGSVLGMVIFGIENQFSWIMIALGFSFTAYFTIKNHLSNLPDNYPVH